MFPALPVFPVFPVLPVAPGGPAGPGEQALNASVISEAATNFVYFTVIPHQLSGKWGKCCEFGALPLTVEITSPSTRRLYADARKQT